MCPQGRAGGDPYSHNEDGRVNLPSLPYLCTRTSKARTCVQAGGGPPIPPVHSQASKARTYLHADLPPLRTHASNKALTCVHAASTMEERASLM